MGFTIRDYADVDEPSWLRCRALSFLGSSYFDDVKDRRTTFDGPSVQLVAVAPRPEGMSTPGEEEVVGVLDVELWEDEGGASVATIDTVAVHPDHQRAGVAGALLDEALGRLRGRGLAWIDAWTREDPEACGWYAAQGFLVDQTYLHVYRGGDEQRADAHGDEGFDAPYGLGAPVKGFFHGPDEDPQVWRARFARVHQCRRYLRRLDVTAWPEDPRLAELYDVENAGTWDHDYFRGLAARLAAHRVTDVGCGTGTLAVALAADGHDVTGLEPARASLDVARRKPGAERVTWVHGYADALPDEAADLVVMTAHVAQYLTTDEDWEATLGHLHRHLAPGGHLAFDSRNPAARAWEGWTPEATRTTYPHPRGGEVTAWAQVDRVEQPPGEVGGEPRGPVVTHVGHTVLEDGHLAYPETLRFRTRAELEESLARTGFEVLEVAGDWDGSAARPDSPEHIVLARRR
ncbi:GNAT family N-acetyltransferase [Serinicoccus kebangsaanensis]|uniref:GNAT family N-acetyltransferase n=1 Tax=Serinicoccus kebangsaanensis TaxID=2602069 RepID=UPI00124C5D80|nr:GNAT family N-acetyltransferase [Serinicoccus kebangsaanensis]